MPTFLPLYPLPSPCVDQMESSNSSTSVSLKLLVDTKNRRVLFAEASKEVVDFLFTLLSLPISTIIRLLTKNGMVGCLGKLYESVEELNDAYLQPNLNKDSLLKPQSTVAGANILHLTYNDSTAKKFYVCDYCNRYISNRSGVMCQNGNCICYNRSITTEVTYVAPPEAAGVASSEEGYVKGVATYMIMDNLEVKPMSTISSITVLNKFNIRDVGALEEKVVSLGMEEGLKLLKASLECNAVLTNVFLGSKA
uniref:uncharacterized protein LOC101305304 n=1 Tax=Fragaria vesca subsp. vesca TaxID=101020 RepID=UPI0005C8B4CF|nr:PREDICTED: uncharacterized protein LOC101305304 [Fragaria vesca subsp. vesca]